MKAHELLQSRRANWNELERLCMTMQNRRQTSLDGATIARFASLYRSACADLALSESFQLPKHTVDYLHNLVGRAHNQLYRSRRFQIRAWSRELFVNVPRQLFRDNCVRLAAAIFWGLFIVAMFLASPASPDPNFASRLVGDEGLKSMRESFSNPPTDRDADGGSFAASFYIWHNTTIGLRVFAWGLLFGVGGLYETAFNAIYLGAIFGHMTGATERDNFYHFVTAHGPFELNAIVLSAATGMRLGWALVATGGLTRVDSLRQAGKKAMPVVGAMMALFALAALIEGFISPSALPYEAKAAVAAISSAMLMTYFVLLGWPPPADEEIDPWTAMPWLETAHAD
jgi:uncharacterized membrane protein SpoIIM required for sporulation